MSADQAIAFIERVKSDAGFRMALNNEPDKVSRLRRVASEGYDFSVAELNELDLRLTDDDLSESLFQERLGGYDSPLGHGQDPSPK